MEQIKKEMNTNVDKEITSMESLDGLENWHQQFVAKHQHFEAKLVPLIEAYKTLLVKTIGKLEEAIKKKSIKPAAIKY